MGALVALWCMAFALACTDENIMLLCLYMKCSVEVVVLNSRSLACLKCEKIKLELTYNEMSFSSHTPCNYWESEFKMHRIHL